MTPRTPTAIDELADKHFEIETWLSPMQMTYLGWDESQDELDDLSPRGAELHHGLVTSTLQALTGLEPADETDAVTAEALRERLGLEVELHDAGEDLMDIANIHSGLHHIRDVFDLMPTATAADWDTIAARLQAVPNAIAQWFESQLTAIRVGIVPAVRQVDALAAQCEGWIGPHGYFSSVVDQARSACPDLPAATRDKLLEGVEVARHAYGQAVARLREQVRPVSAPQDGVGQERYELWSRSFLGTKIDLAQTYRWGLDQVAELEVRQAEICARLRPGLSVCETKKALDLDPAYTLNGSDAMRAWMQRAADKAIEWLSGVHFDIAEPARRIECMIAPTHDGGIYYTDPADDFSRPGRMWWSVPESQTRFSTWRELTTVYHEGVPGHHLQISAAALNQDLNKWRQHGIWVSGHGEGWALYAEQLMADLGFHSDPGTMLGMLDSLTMRAARVVIDIGVHCGFPAPAEVGGGDWTFDKALAYFNTHATADPDVARFEVTRYFGWPGQAPSYKIGQRIWTEIRDEVKQREGTDFDLKAFHSKALNLGALGLDTLRQALL